MRFGLVVGLLFATVLAAGCNSDYAMTARNDTNQRYMLRVPWPSDPEHLSVNVIEPHGSNVVLSWNGDPAIEFELLDPNCVNLGEFTSTDGTTFTVSGIPGVTLTLIRGFSNLSFRNNGDVYKVTDCGGYVEM